MTLITKVALPADFTATSCAWSADKPLGPGNGEPGIYTISYVSPAKMAQKLEEFLLATRATMEVRAKDLSTAHCGCMAAEAVFKNRARAIAMHVSVLH